MGASAPATGSAFDDARSGLSRRQKVGTIALGVFVLATLSAVAALLVLIADVMQDGALWLSLDFLRDLPSRQPLEAGLWPALVGSIWIMLLTALFTFPVGVGAAVYLHEFSNQGRLSKIIELNISNLAGVPSIVYGLLGLGVFVELLELGPSILAGALTMTLLVLPVVIIASREAIRAVPDSLRQAALGLGATRWQMVRSHVIPAAMPGILTGTILALSRAIGETAPLIVVGAATYITFTPTAPDSRFTVLPLQIFDWVSRPQENFHAIAAAGIIVLLVLLLTMNAAAILLRNHFRKSQNW